MRDARFTGERIIRISYESSEIRASDGKPLTPEWQFGIRFFPQCQHALLRMLLSARALLDQSRKAAASTGARSMAATRAWKRSVFSIAPVRNSAPGPTAVMGTGAAVCPVVAQPTTKP